MPKDPDILVELTKTLTDFDAEVIAAALREEGIPATVFSRANSVLQGPISPLPTIAVSVRRGDLERARVILEEIRTAAQNIDWSQVDTSGEPVRVASCPSCGYQQAGIPLTAPCPECGSSVPLEISGALESDLAVVPLRARRRRRLIKIAIACLILFGLYVLIVSIMQGSDYEAMWYSRDVHFVSPFLDP